MPKYRHYLFDGAGNIRSAEWLDADGDEDAVLQVRERELNCPSEIWERKRLVARIEAGGAKT